MGKDTSFFSGVWKKQAIARFGAEEERLDKQLGDGSNSHSLLMFDVLLIITNSRVEDQKYVYIP